MKQKILLSLGAAFLIAAVSAFVYVKNERNSVDELFNANVDALADWEDDPGLEDYVWYVRYHGDDAITCTVGGNQKCQG